MLYTTATVHRKGILRRNSMWKNSAVRLGTALLTLALAACSVSEFLSATSDMSNPQSGVVFDYQTSFATLPSASVLMLVRSASTMWFDTENVDGRACLGLESAARGQSPEDACLRFANVSRWKSDDLNPLARHSPFPGPELNPEFDHRVGVSLVRACGQYTSSTRVGTLEGGAGCGLLGAFLADEENIEAAKAVWEQAPGCHTQDLFGDPRRWSPRRLNDVTRDWSVMPD